MTQEDAREWIRLGAYLLLIGVSLAAYRIDDNSKAKFYWYSFRSLNRIVIWLRKWEVEMMKRYYEEVQAW
jgi:hypothetical protein